MAATAILEHERSELTTGDRGARQGDVDRFLSPATAAAGLCVPFVGVIYGIIRVGYEQYYSALGLSPEVVGLGQAAIVSGVGVLVGLLAALIATWVMFGIVVYRVMAPLRSGHPDAERSWRQWLILLLEYAAGFGVALIPFVIARWVAGGRGVALWASGAVTSGVIGLEASFALGDSELRMGERIRQATRSVYRDATPRVGLLLVLTILGGAAVSLTLNFWDDATRAGRVVRDSGRLPMALSVTVSPARIIPRSDDPVGACNGSKKAVLVGRGDGVSYVLLLPSQPSDGSSEILPLDDDNYAVATGLETPQSCSPRAP